MRTRIGRVMPEQRDVWWTLERDSDLQKISREVAVAIDLHGLPWFKGHEFTKLYASDEPLLLFEARVASAFANMDGAEFGEYEQQLRREYPSAKASISGLVAQLHWAAGQDRSEDEENP